MAIPKLTLLHCLLIIMGLKSLIYMIVVPIWHGPDEQAHFAQVQYQAEFGRSIPNRHDFKDLSQEIYISETLLGTLRDERGMNKFTLHPEFRPEYTHTTIGKYEQLINHLPRENRTTFVKWEAPHYPPLFYYLSGIFYRLGYPLGLVDRLMLTRVASVIMGIILVYFTFRIANLIFDPLTAITMAAVTAFQPMFSFLTSTVNSDNLMNVLFTIFLYLCAKLVTTQKITLKDCLLLLLVILAGFWTKPHFVIALPILGLLPLFLRRFKLFFGLILLMAILSIRILTGPPIAFSEVSTLSLTNPNNPVGLIQHIRWTVRHTIAEVIPWYWGVFNWLGVTLPRVVNRVINRLLIVAAFGVLIWFAKHRQKTALFLGLSSLVYFVVLMLWDFLFVRVQGFSFGMQGRYYFPTLSVQMILLVAGLSVFIPKKLIGLASILLNFIGLYTLTSAYYQTWPLATLFNQVSQYKPYPFKFPWLLIWVTLYVFFLILFIIRYLKYAPDSRSRS